MALEAAAAKASSRSRADENHVGSFLGGDLAETGRRITVGLAPLGGTGDTVLGGHACEQMRCSNLSCTALGHVREHETKAQSFAEIHSDGHRPPACV